MLLLEVTLPLATDSLIQICPILIPFEHVMHINEGIFIRE